MDDSKKELIKKDFEDFLSNCFEKLGFTKSKVFSELEYDYALEHDYYDLLDRLEAHLDLVAMRLKAQEEVYSGEN